MKVINSCEIHEMMYSEVYEVKVDFGNGLEEYEGCTHNLEMILDAPETEAWEMEKEDNPAYWVEDKRLFKVRNMFLPADLYFWIEE